MPELDQELAREAREGDMDAFRSMVCERRRAIKERWEKTGDEAVGAKQADAGKRDREKPEYRCSLVAREIKTESREGLFAASLPLEAKICLFRCGLAWGRRVWISSM